LEAVEIAGFGVRQQYLAYRKDTIDLALIIDHATFAAASSTFAPKWKKPVSFVCRQAF
jgi:hypothetical protein